jgi:hypothetical protein
VAVFLEWFSNCFVWEVQEHFQEQCVKLNALVVLDNASVIQRALHLFIPLLNWCSYTPTPHLSFSYTIRDTEIWGILSTRSAARQWLQTSSFRSSSVGEITTLMNASSTLRNHLMNGIIQQWRYVDRRWVTKQEQLYWILFPKWGGQEACEMGEGSDDLKGVS